MIAEMGGRGSEDEVKKTFQKEKEKRSNRKQRQDMKTREAVQKINVTGN